MESHIYLVFVHVLLFVYWLGPDWGVYVNSAYVAREDLPIDERRRFLVAALRIDLLPRSSLILLLPVGLQLARNIGLVQLPAAAMAGIWIAGICWLLVSWTVYRRRGAASAMPWKRLDNGIRVVLSTVLIGLSIYALATGDVFVARWLAVKVGGFGLLLVLGLMLRRVMGGWAQGFQRLEREGSTPETEAMFSQSLRRAKPIVYVFWATSAMMGFMGVVKPF